MENDKQIFLVFSVTSYVLHDYMRILAIDPGYERLGVAVIEKLVGREHLIYSDCFRTKPETPHPLRLLAVSNFVRDAIKHYRPDALAIETILFSKNRKTATALSEVRGTIITEAARGALPINE